MNTIKYRMKTWEKKAYLLAVVSFAIGIAIAVGSILLNGGQVKDAVLLGVAVTSIGVSIDALLVALELI